MVIIHQFYEPFLCKKTTFFVLYPILRFFLQKIIVSAWYITQKRFLSILPGADEKTGPPPPKKGSPVFQCAENRRNSYKSYKPDAPGRRQVCRDKRKPRALPDGKARGFWWARVDSNHRSIKQQIYSLSPLATREHALILFGRPACLAGRLVYFTTGFAVCQQLF